MGGIVCGAHWDFNRFWSNETNAAVTFGTIVYPDILKTACVI